MASKYWDDFERREKETVECLKVGSCPPIRRVAIYITEKCNFKCNYCNMINKNNEMPFSVFDSIVKKYGSQAILHITGGEPSTVKWLYDYIETNNQVFNLNTNAFIKPPIKNVNRMKISFDTQDKHKFNSIVNRDAFDKVVNHIKLVSKTSTVSLTCVLSKETFLNTIELAEYVNKNFPNVYALFFSFYKGDNKFLQMLNTEIDYFFNTIKPKLVKKLNPESKELLNETLTHKYRLYNGIRFPENALNPVCYLSMSERVVGPDGLEYKCSHLFRDKIYSRIPIKHKKCLYGCNTRLVKFNIDVCKKLNERQNNEINHCVSDGSRLRGIVRRVGYFG